MSKIWQQLASIWGRLEVPQKATIILSVVAAGVLFGLITYSATRPDYRLLASGLTKAQVAEIVAYLDQSKVQYTVADNETAVMVPSKDLYRLRNELAQREMLGDGSKGFELMDKTGMFTSTFGEHKTYDRSLAGELERSFRELPGVRSARVLIDRPQPSPFIDDEAGKAKASVKLDMANGARLTARQIQGVVHLVAGAVAGLTTDRVEVMDGTGLLNNRQADSGAQMANTALEAEIARESYLTRQAQEQLDTILGPGRSQVKVSVKLDFTRRSEQSSDPTKSVALEERNQTTDEKIPVLSQGGVAGTSPNVEGDGQAAAKAPAMGSKTNEQTETKYVVGKKTVTQEDEIGRIKGMNVSILLDHQVTKVAKNGPDGKPTGEFDEKRDEFTAPERERFKELVLNAIGFNSAKDIAAKVEGQQNLDTRFTVSVQSMDLYRAPEPVAEASLVGGLSLKMPWLDVAGYVLTGIVAIAFLIIARGQLKRSHAAWAIAEARARGVSEAKLAVETAKDTGIETDEAQEEAKAKRLEMKSQIKKRVMDDPNAAAQVLRKWLYE